MIRLLLTALGALALAASVRAETVINGAGATFPQPVYVRWFEKYSTVNDSLRIDYRGVGSRGGRELILDGEVDFGASDVPISDADLQASSRTIWHLPTVTSAVAICYNLPGLKALKLDGPTLAAIYLGKVTQWNAPEIAVLNPGAKLPDQAIVPVYLSEGGTLTEIFARYLSAISPAWKAAYPAEGGIAWRTGVGGSGNLGAARKLVAQPGAIGYIELTFAHRMHLQTAALKNHDGQFVAPDAATVSAAVAHTEIPDDFRFYVINPAGADAYPIGVVTWMLVDRHPIDAAKGRKLVEFLDWVYGDGGSTIDALGFVPLPEPVRKRVLDRLAQIQL